MAGLKIYQIGMFANLIKNIMLSPLEDVGKMRKFDSDLAKEK